MKTVRKAAEHYTWKDVCDGWHLLKRDDLSIIEERMPPGTEEDMHYHQKARQFFYILSGNAAMRLSDSEISLSTGDSIEISPMEKHQMINDSDSDTRFIVISMPKSHGDRVTC